MFQMFPYKARVSTLNQGIHPQSRRKYSRRRWLLLRPSISSVQAWDRLKFKAILKGGVFGDNSTSSIWLLLSVKRILPTVRECVYNGQVSPKNLNNCNLYYYNSSCDMRFGSVLLIINFIDGRFFISISINWLSLKILFAVAVLVQSCSAWGGSGGGEARGEAGNSEAWVRNGR